jgi:hypothetical protein
MLVWEDDSRTHNTTARVVPSPDSAPAVRSAVEAQPTPAPVADVAQPAARPP